MKGCHFTLKLAGCFWCPQTALLEICPTADKIQNGRPRRQTTPAAVVIIETVATVSNVTFVDLEPWLGFTNVEVSENSGTYPQIIHLNRLFHQNHPF